MSNQVPAILEVTTNKTSSNKRFFYSGKYVAIIRKSKTEINAGNYKILQFLDMFHFVSIEEVKRNKTLLIDYIKKNNFTKKELNRYIGLYSFKTVKKIMEGGLIDAFI